MSALHFYYLTRWAVRNDPALGVPMVVTLSWIIGWHQGIRDVRREIEKRILYNIIALTP